MMTQNFLRCGIFGLSMEVLWTGLHAFRVRDRKLTGNSSLWMFPIYGCASFLSPLMHRLRRLHTLPRGLIYMTCIYAGEYVSGSLLKRYDLCPWDYSRCQFHYKGLIRLDFAPLWFATGLLFEKILTADP